MILTVDRTVETRDGAAPTLAERTETRYIPHVHCDLGTVGLREMDAVDLRLERRHESEDPVLVLYLSAKEGRHRRRLVIPFSEAPMICRAQRFVLLDQAGFDVHFHSTGVQELLRRWWYVSHVPAAP
jgi:hypothetical protein